jgi:hypothetical protein
MEKLIFGDKTPVIVYIERRFCLSNKGLRNGERETGRVFCPHEVKLERQRVES